MSNVIETLLRVAGVTDGSRGDGGSAVLVDKTITENGEYDPADDNADGYSGVTVNVSGGSATLVTKSIAANGTYNASSDSADGYSSVTVNVPNTYAAGDEGKVVSNGALVAQTSETVSANGTYDTTTKNSVTVNVPSSSPTLTTKSITANGTYNAASDNADGYSSVTVNVSGGGGGEIVTITVDVANNTVTADKTLQEIQQMTNPVAVFTDSSGRAYITTDQELVSTGSQTKFYVNGFGLDYSLQDFNDNIYGRCSAIGVHYTALYRSGRTSYSSGIDAYTFSHVTT